MTTSEYIRSSVPNIFDGTNLRVSFNVSNTALKDTLLALDPTKLLIYGESAGGDMTRYLLGTDPKYMVGLFSGRINSRSNPVSSPESALSTSLQLAKYVGWASNSSTGLVESDVGCVANTSARDLAITSLNLDDIANGLIMDGIYAHLPCEHCYFLPTTLAPRSPPSSFVFELPNYFNETQIRRILNQTELYPYETTSLATQMNSACVRDSRD
ncbi:hypothetical protein F4604DRAFT_1882836 [Suillus subluteus]|nr:hypothetical protein F4604DRAFT_1882836 [Suillus subluteus]